MSEFYKQFMNQVNSLIPSFDIFGIHGEQDTNKNNSKHRKSKYSEHDLLAEKKEQRIFSQIQKDQCWNKVIFIIKIKLFT